MLRKAPKMYFWRGISGKGGGGGGGEGGIEVEFECMADN